MEKIEFKNATFYPNAIVLMKYGNLRIDIADIDHIIYKKPTLLNYLLVYLSGSAPGYMQIHLRKKVCGTDFYQVKLKYKEVMRLEDFFQKKIDLMAM